ncbi:SH3 domain-containing protein [uncultured Helicobacter sp.]|uniref:SH3 domain-containing protein n=1 Tax=uncultured Helicobacter sp. TaxID=175537 RepID=UPI003752047E
MPLKFFFKLYFIPALIVVVGICLYFFVFVEIKDKRVPHFHTYRQSPTTESTQADTKNLLASRDSQNPIIVVEEPKPEIVLERDLSESPAQEAPLPKDSTQETPSTPQVSPAPKALPTSQPHYVYVNVRSANIRALPSTDGEVLHRANSGARLTLIQALPQSDWSEVEISPGLRGYIASYLLSDQSPQSDIHQVIVRSANIRALPSSDAPIITAVGFNHNVRVLQDDGQWSKVLLESGQEGYIASRLLKK